MKRKKRERQRERGSEGKPQTGREHRERTSTKPRAKGEQERPENQKRSRNDGDFGRKLLALFQGETSSQTESKICDRGGSWSSRMGVSRGTELVRVRCCSLTQVIGGAGSAAPTFGIPV